MSDAVPDTPSVVAEIDVDPLATAVATPLDASIVATFVSEEAQVNVFPKTRVPSASLATAVNGWVAPSPNSIGELGVT